MSVTDPWRPFPVRYYVFALLFLIFFDVRQLLYPGQLFIRTWVYGFVGDDYFVFTSWA